MNEWVCDLCYPTTIEIGEVASGLWLCYRQGAYLLIGDQGHAGSIIWSSDLKPVVSPLDGIDENTLTDDHFLWTEDINWIDIVEQQMFIKDLATKATHSAVETSSLLYVWKFVELLRTAGFDPNHEAPEFWLYNKMGILARDWIPPKNVA